jgi:hypothetical protein
MVVRWLAVRQARVRISVRAPMEVPPTEPAAVKIRRWDPKEIFTDPQHWLKLTICVENFIRMQPL